MIVTVEIPSVLQPCVQGASQVRVRATCVRGVLSQIERLYPELHRSVCDETGAVRKHVNLFVNDSLIRQSDQLDASLASGDVIAIFQAVSGG